jgi:hypothetical protein
MSSSSPSPAPERGRRALLVAAAAATLAPLARAQQAAGTPPPEVSAELREARLQGNGRLRFLGLHIYDARLWSPLPVADYAAMPLALELEYGRALDGPKIAERSLDEMRRVGSFDEATGRRWLEAMTRLFPDVKAGDRLTGVHRPGEAARFFLNGALRGEVREPEFARLFFGIWLSPRTSEPGLRKQLLGPTATPGSGP